MPITEKQKTIALLVALFIFAAFALFFDLGDRMLWGDEAETALLGVNITKFGLPKATDGKNYVTLLGAGRDTNKDDIWIWSPWLDKYIAAASFILFGKTTTTARLPFVLIAFISVLFLPLLAHQLYHDNELTVIATLLYVTNVAFILHSRQCRYYALVFLAQMLIISGYHRLLIGHAKPGIFYLVLGLTVEFYCNYILVVSNVLAIVLSIFVIHRRQSRLLRNHLISLMIFALLVIPWLLYAEPWHQSRYAGFHHFGRTILYYLEKVHFHIVPLVLLLVPAIMHLSKRIKLHTPSQGLPVKNTLVFLWVLIPVHLLILSAPPSLYFRYLIPLIPVFILLSSAMIVDYVRVKYLRYLLVGALSLSNVVSVLSAYPVRSGYPVNMPIIRFVSEMTVSYTNTLEDVVLFMRKNAGPNESLLVLDSEFPLIFYTDMRIIDAYLHPRLRGDDLPDWILAESASGVSGTKPLRLPSVIENAYELILLRVHDSPRGDSRPNPDFHVSFTSDRLREFKIYKKRK